MLTATSEANREADMRRILIIGSGGAGKSTLAVKLGDALGIPVHHLDALFWKPGWIMTPIEERRAKLSELMQDERWLLDGNFNSTLELRIPEADTIVFLDLPRTTCLWRVTKRRVRYHGMVRPSMGSGCPEQLNWSFFKWIWNYPRNARPRVLSLLAEAKRDGKRIVHLRSDAEVTAFVSSAIAGRSRSVAAPMRKVLIFGPAGSGKTTVTDRLAVALGIGAIHLEWHYWQPGWTEPDPDQFRATVAALAEGERWVMDGTFPSTLDLRLPKADTVILLDPPRRTYFRRVLMRTARYLGRSRAEVGPDCPDRVDLAFLRAVWNYPHTRRPELLRLLSEIDRDKQVIILRSDAEVDALIATAQRSSLMRNVLVFGSSGAGKSTFARALGDRLGIETIHLDATFWKPGWVESNDDEFREKVAALAARDAWVMDGNYSRTLDLRLPKTDTIIYLDVPRYVCMWRVLKRIARTYGRTRDDLGEGCPEQIDLAFLKWVWDYPKERKPKTLRILGEQRAEKQVIVLQNQREVTAFLKSVEPLG